MDYAPWEGKRMGSYGEGAGAAYVFSRSSAEEGYVWRQDQVLVALVVGVLHGVVVTARAVLPPLCPERVDAVAGEQRRQSQL